MPVFWWNWRPGHRAVAGAASAVAVALDITPRAPRAGPLDVGKWARAASQGAGRPLNR